MLVSVITPCFNEELTVEDCVQRLAVAMNSIGIEFEHILVDNASSDRTVETLLQLKNDFHHVRVLKNEFNIGAFKSMQRGILAAQGELIVPFLAADCQDPPELIPAMLKIRDEIDCDTVAGVRQVRHDNFVISRFRRLFYRIIYLATKGKYHPGSSEFRLIPKTQAIRLASVKDSIPFLRIYMAQVQGRVEYLNYEMASRKAGQSSASFFPLVDDALNGIMLASPSIFSRLLVCLVPLTLLGAGLTVLQTILFAFNLAHSWILLSSSLMATVLCLFAVIQLLIGHYVFMIHSQVRSGPDTATIEL
jgi:glycosyltransferase involved in cell wall biosynthesis